MLLDERAAGEHLGGNGKPRSLRTMQRWRQIGCGPPFIKIGAAVRYDDKDLDEWLARQRRQSTSETAPSENSPRRRRRRAHK
jgi:hypothetical protein